MTSSNPINQASQIVKTSDILHIDMDAFFMSVEQIERPELANRPCYVGGGPRGVVLSANYLARSYGIKSGMACQQARRRCPKILEIPPDFDHYAQVSQGLKILFASVTERLEMASVDEAFLDVSGAKARLGSPSQIAQWLHAQVANEQQIPCSVGIGPNRLIAKMASKSAKPNGIYLVPPDQVIEFLHPLPVDALWSVGPATAAKFHQLGIHQIEQLAKLPTDILQRIVGVQAGRQLAQFAWGIDHRPIQRYRPEQSIGAQHTLPDDSCQYQLIKQEILRLAAKVASRLRASGYCARQLTLSLRFADFSNLSASRQLTNPTDVTDEIAASAWTIFQAWRLQRVKIRRIGLKMSQLLATGQAYRQPALGEAEKGMRDVEQVVDRIAAKFGSKMVTRASLAGN